MHQPGERWMYHTGSEVLGVLVARASGQPLETFFRERIFEPLRMKDTGFDVPAAKLGRLASCYWADAETGKLDLLDDARNSRWSRPPAFPAGGGGLVSTVDDYLTFGQMMLNKGNAWEQAHPVETFGRDHDDRPSDTRAEGRSRVHSRRQPTNRMKLL